MVKGFVGHVRNLNFRQIPYRDTLKPLNTLKPRFDVL